MAQGSLVDVVNHLLDRGVSLQGDTVVSLAGVDLVYLRLNVLLSSVESLRHRGGWADELPAEAVPSQPRPLPPPESVAAALGAARRPGQPPSGGADLPAGLLLDAPPVAAPYASDAQVRVAAAKAAEPGVTPPPASLPQAGQNGPSRSLAQLVLTLTEFLRQIVERQALRRVEGGGLDDAQLEKIGLALADLERSMKEMRELFDIEEHDLELDLGPLGQIV